MIATPFLMLFILMLSTIGFTGLTLYLLPRLTRPDIYFAVTVKPDFRESEDGRVILAQYRREIVFHSLLAVALVIWGTRLQIQAFFLVGIFWQVAGFFSAFLRGRKKVMPHAVEPSTVREAELGPSTTRLSGGWLVQSAPFAILITTGLWLRLHWSQIPDRFPIHWGLDGRPNGWASRTLLGVYAPLVTGLVICGGLFLLNYGIAAFSRRIRVSGGAAETELRFKHIMLSIMLGSEFFVALLISWVGLLALHGGKTGPNPAPILLCILALVALITFLIIRTGQGGTRLAVSNDLASGAEQSPVGDRTLDRCWKAGMFYFNSDDPAIMVEARFGVGYTLNLGRPLSWVILALLVGLPLASAMVMKYLK